MPPAGMASLEEAQREAEAAAATLIERKFKEPANLEVQYSDGVLVLCNWTDRWACLWQESSISTEVHIIQVLHSHV